MALLMAFGAIGAPLQKIAEHSLVRVRVTLQKPDVNAPWKRESIRDDVHMGIVLDERHILVSAYAAAYARHFEYQKIDESRRVPLKLAFVDYNANLALLTLPEEGAFAKLKPIVLGRDLGLGDQATLLNARSEERLIADPVRVREVKVQSALFSSFPLPHYAFETQQAAAGWSEPIIEAGKLVGMTVSKNEDTIFAVPVSLIRKFWADYRQPPYRGFAKLGLSLSPMVSPELRSYAGLDVAGEGVWISQVLVDSPFHQALKAGDVLLRVGERALDDRGFFAHPKWGRMSFVSTIYQWHGGDDVTLVIARDGQKQTIKRQIEAYDPHVGVIPDEAPRQVPFVIFGGLIFQELSEHYLKSWGSNWRRRAPLNFLNLWLRRYEPDVAGQNRIIILNRVLPDPFNRGYENLQNLRLTHVGNEPVESLAQLRQLLERLAESGEAPAYAVFRLAPYQHRIILPFAGLNEAHKRIKQSYGVNREQAFWPGG
jgi:hypothetical protein